MIDVGALNVPARREARHVKGERTRGIGDGAVMIRTTRWRDVWRILMRW